MFEHTHYSGSCPEVVWREWQQATPEELSVEDSLTHTLASHVLDERGDELDADTRQELRRFTYDDGA